MVRIANTNEVDSRQASLLQGVAEAARELLTVADFDAAINGALEVLARSAGIDRIYIFENHSNPTTHQEFADCPYEWTIEGVVNIREIPGQYPFFYKDAGFEAWLAELKAGRVVQKLTQALSDAEKVNQVQEGGVLSLLTVPIFVKGQYWGLIGFDDCTTERVWSDAEIAVLETAATCIGSAIERERLRLANLCTRKAKEAAAKARVAELAERDRILEATAVAANTMLTDDDFDSAVNKALKIVGEGLGVDRVSLWQYFDASVPQENSYTQGLYEWTAENVPVQIAHPELASISDEGVEFMIETLRAGRIFGGVVEELPEPFRSIQLKARVKSIYNVPFFVNNRFWGVIGFDDCHKLTRRSEAELEALRMLANCIGSAIEQDLTQKAREAALKEKEKAARDRATELAKINEAISRTLSTLATNPELDNFLCFLVQELSKVIDAHHTALFLYNPEDNTLYRHIAFQDNKAYVGAIPRDAEVLQKPFPADITDAWRLILESPHPITVAETGTPEDNPNNFWWQDTVDWYTNEGHKELACARLKVGNVPLGFISFCFREHRTFSDAQLEVIQALANQATLAIQFTRLVEEAKQAAILQEQEKAAQERAAELAKTNEAIAQTLTTLAARPELDQFLGTILAEISRKLNAAKVHLFLYDSPTHKLHQRVVVQDGQIHLGIGPNDPEMLSRPIPADITPAWKAIISAGKRLTYNENEPLDETIWSPETFAWHKAQGHKSVTCVPMKAGDQPIGYIDFCFYQHTRLTDEQLEFMQALTNQAIVAIQLTRLADQSRNAALTDERNRLAREIHDTLAQAFTGVSLQLEAVRSLFSRESHSQGTATLPATSAQLDNIQTYILRARDLARQGLSEARRSVHALRSEALETDSLPEALHKALDQTQRDTGLETNLQIEGEPYPLTDDQQLNLLRIAQEAITNTLRHARATQITLTLTFSPSEIHLNLLDNGIGFELQSLVDTSGFGLIGIQERAARLRGIAQISSQPHQGTLIEVTLPAISHSPYP